MAEIVRTERAERVFVSYHQLTVGDRAFDKGNPDHSLDDLASSRPGLAVIWTGVHTGFLDVTIQLATATPPTPPPGAWEAGTEIDLITLTGETVLCGLMGEPPPGFPGLTPQAPGRYRMRVHARGRSRNNEAYRQVCPEVYLITVWPVDVGPEAAARYQETADGEPPSRSDLLLAWAREQAANEPGRPARRVGKPPSGATP
ncbi:hypothetical protein [Nonomuraea roseoviolacea]|uniref:Uncharacterized protein n=1 Tax=Nonomuraea roseoviolacea subsp. carminata TaxID=160689 RepID=A0ABT1K8I9_9ACTN|nr:hypothetical protein [Nonomuraea roseoviolacea]MCP2350323.1 hypothetical protein [Nonomuraea roseoviolacea subsp. carminata]